VLGGGAADADLRVCGLDRECGLVMGFGEGGVTDLRGKVGDGEAAA
jgi:hypothetical protein